MHQVGLYCTVTAVSPFPLLPSHPPTPPLTPRPSHRSPSHHSLPYSLDSLHCIVSCLVISHTQVSQAVQEGDKDTDHGDRIRECKDPQSTAVLVHSHVLHV